MLQINGKTFMNIQEAVQWLLDNNALPFQSSANYQANTEIGLGTIVNPSPAKVRIGSLIFFADSKVSTVVGLTENGFICSDQYNDLVDDIVYVANVAINDTGHLIVTLSNGNTIDAGLIKQVASFSINASQHLIANYNDGTSTDLGAIFSGNVNIAGNLTADSIIENMAGYSFIKSSIDSAIEVNYAGVVKNGNKLTFVVAGKASKASGSTSVSGDFIIPQAIADKIIPIQAEYVSIFNTTVIKAVFDTPITKKVGVQKISSYFIRFIFFGLNSDLLEGEQYMFRLEQTFLLSENLAS